MRYQLLAGIAGLCLCGPLLMTTTTVAQSAGARCDHPGAGLRSARPGPLHRPGRASTLNSRSSPPETPEFLQRRIRQKPPTPPRRPQQAGADRPSYPSHWRGRFPPQMRAGYRPLPRTILRDRHRARRIAMMPPWFPYSPPFAANAMFAGPYAVAGLPLDEPGARQAP